MKIYRLKQWYPSLDEKWDTTHRYEYQSSTGYMCNKSIQHCVIIYKKELHSDFWEEVEKPLFITDDGVKVFSDIDNLFAVNLTYFSKTRNMLRSSSWLIDNPSYKVFSIESNADEYIWKNKPMFSLQDIDFTFDLNLEEFEKLEQLAIEKVNGKI